jgi:hypothetical protein
VQVGVNMAERVTKNYKFYQKLNYNCPASEKNGSGPGSCKDTSGSSSESKSAPKERWNTSIDGYGYGGHSAADISDISKELMSREKHDRMYAGGSRTSGYIDPKDTKKWESFKSNVKETLSKMGFEGDNLLPAVVESILEDANYHTLNDAIKELDMYDDDPSNVDVQNQYEDYLKETRNAPMRNPVYKNRPSKSR